MCCPILLNIAKLYANSFPATKIFVVLNAKLLRPVVPSTACRNNTRVDACARIFYRETFVFIVSCLNKTKSVFINMSVSIRFEI